MRYKNSCIAALVGGVSMLATSAAAMQESADTDDMMELEEILIVVGRTTNVDITANDLTKLQANTLQDIFRDTPSISIGGGIGLAQKIYVRGVEDTLLNITVDGAPQTGTLFHHIGRVSIEPELLKEVRVQAGAGEATSGFGAIGGSVRFKTKDADDLLEDGETFGALAKAGYFSNDGYKLNLNAYGKLSENWGFLGSYVYVDRDNSESGNGAKINGSSAEQSLAFFKVSGDLTDNQHMSLSYEQRDEEALTAARPNWQITANDRLYEAKAKRQTAVFNYSNNLSDFVNLDIASYYTKAHFEQNRDDRWGRYGADMETYGFDIRNTSNIGNHEATYGVEYRHDKVSSEYLEDVSIWGIWAWDASLGYFEETGKLLGVYFQDHYSVNDKLTLSFGARYDSYKLDMVTYSEAFDSEDFSWNAGFNYEITPALSFNAGYAEAARGKEVSDAFTLEKRPGRIRLNPNLRSENVENIEAGLVYEANGWLASIAYYNSKITDVLFDEIGRGDFPQDTYYFDNIGNYNAEGWEFKLAYTADKWYFASFYTVYDADLNGNPVEAYEHNGLGNLSGDKFVANIAYTPSESFEIGWRFTHVQDMNDIEVFHRSLDIGWVTALDTIDKAGYTLNDIYVQWLPTGNDNIKVNLAVNNIFDVLYRDHASVGDYTHIPDYEIVVGPYEAGRDIRLSVAYKF